MCTNWIIFESKVNSVYGCIALNKKNGMGNSKFSVLNTWNESVNEIAEKVPGNQITS